MPDPPNRSEDDETGRRRSLFREVNERIEQLSHHAGHDDGTLALLCECGSLGCTEPIQVPRVVYRSLRAVPGRFLLKSGHENGGSQVVLQQDGYRIIEPVGDGSESP